MYNNKRILQEQHHNFLHKIDYNRQLTRVVFVGSMIWTSVGSSKAIFCRDAKINWGSPEWEAIFFLQLYADFWFPNLLGSWWMCYTGFNFAVVHVRFFQRHLVLSMKQEERRFLSSHTLQKVNQVFLCVNVNATWRIKYWDRKSVV